MDAITQFLLSQAVGIAIGMGAVMAPIILRALAGQIRAYVKGTPTKADDEAGERLARAMEELAELHRRKGD